jgi:hypothetical protein
MLARLDRATHDELLRAQRQRDGPARCFERHARSLRRVPPRRNPSTQSARWRR